MCTHVSSGSAATQVSATVALSVVKHHGALMLYIRPVSVGGLRQKLCSPMPCALSFSLYSQAIAQQQIHHDSSTQRETETETSRLVLAAERETSCWLQLRRDKVACALT